MDILKAWQQFEKTGLVSDYMKYLQSVQQPQAKQHREDDSSYADYYQGDSDTRQDFRG